MHLKIIVHTKITELFYVGHAQRALRAVRGTNRADRISPLKQDPVSGDFHIFLTHAWLEEEGKRKILRVWIEWEPVTNNALGFSGKTEPLRAVILKSNTLTNRYL